jgi:hypothetical protein
VRNSIVFCNLYSVLFLSITILSDAGRRNIAYWEREIPGRKDRCLQELEGWSSYLKEDKAQARGAHDGFGAALDIELAEDRVDMELDRVLANAQLPRDSFVALTLRQ